MINRRSFFGLLAGATAVNVIDPTMAPAPQIPDPYDIGEVLVVPMSAKPKHLTWKEYLDIVKEHRILLCEEQDEGYEIRKVDLSSDSPTQTVYIPAKCELQVHKDPPKHGALEIIKIKFSK